MANERRGLIPEGLSHLFDVDSDAVAIAGELVRVVLAITAVLTPILGPRGVAALFQRAVHVTGTRHAWLAGSADVAGSAVDHVALGAPFARQDREEAAAAAMALLLCFHDLLASLIGDALCARLLDPVWAPPPRRPTPQDTTP